MWNPIERCLSTIMLLLMLTAFSCKHDLGPVNDGLLLGVDPCHPDTVYFENDILPLMISTCATSGCHDAKTREEGVVLDSYDNIMKEVKKGNPKKSELYKVLNESGEDRMPPPPLDGYTAAQKQLVFDWIDQGALENGCQSECDTTAYTYSAGVGPILEKYCNGCHNDNNTQGKVKLLTYDQVLLSVDNGSLLGTIKQDGYELMPPGNAMPECQITIIENWIKNGAPND